MLAKNTNTLLYNFEEACSVAETSIKNTSEVTRPKIGVDDLKSKTQMKQDLKVEIQSSFSFQKGDDIKVSTKNVEIKKEIEAMKIEI